VAIFDAEGCRVEICMSESVVIVQADAPIEEVVSMMEERQVRRVPVVDEKGCGIGIISRADVASVGRTHQVAELVREVSREATKG
jgi:CBS-domain-containing membrane protein